MSQKNLLMQLILQSDGMTKLILLSLLIMSIVCWTIFIYKAVLLYIKKRQLKEASLYLKKISTLDDIRIMLPSFSNTLPGYVIANVLGYFKGFLDTKNYVVDYEYALLKESTDQLIDEVIHKQEEYVSFLSASAAISPLIGLFGTVWGLIHSFVSIAERQQADIATVAPGIAEALITTLAGLMVAIPALCMFHYLIGQIRSIEQEVLSVSENLDRILQKFLNKA